MRFGLHVHLPGTAEIVEVVDEQPAHESLNGPVNIAEGHTLLQHFLPVELQELLRHARSKGRGYRANFGPLATGGYELLPATTPHQDTTPTTPFHPPLNAHTTAPTT